MLLPGFLTLARETRLPVEIAEIGASAGLNLYFDRCHTIAKCSDDGHLLNAAGRLNEAAKPILEINPHHERIVALAKLGAKDRAFRDDVAHLLYDEASVLDGDKPVDARAFSDRLARLMTRGLPGDV